MSHMQRRAYLAWARSHFAHHNNTRLGGETSEHTSIELEFSLRRVPLARARYSVTQSMGSSPGRDPRAPPHIFTNPRLGEQLSPGRDVQT
ncbi:hypothetical protein DEO72_LG1g2598 [Vigna unguiculata]|uniref:Uncharacterized protein n=1 Tax=Vigna unguiculata TaxID=3917 RepID=A0A4D6KWT7_VIGUN|nr:hypothetical protein DEO72_LG1g2598 [Vigna unguiculata]